MNHSLLNSQQPLVIIILCHERRLSKKSKIKEKARKDDPLRLSLMKKNTSLYVGIYYLQWRLVELPDMITRRLISVCLYDAR
jgi:hypothetical protein